jgi:hypothetical protein
MRFRPVNGKNPGASGKLWCGDSYRNDDGTDWNSELWKWQTAEQIALTMAEPSNTYTGVGLMTGRQVGGYCWLDFDGEEVDQATGEIKKSATTDFFAIWQHPVSDLPPAPRNISGREGRFRLLFRVPVAWQDYLRGVYLNSVGPTKAIEFLYETAGGKCFHAVADGKHPKGNGWFYRWVDGESPREIPVPDLPAWMIAGILKHEHKKKLKKEGWNSEGSPSTGENEPGPIDVLNPGQQKKLLKGMQEFFPYRGAPIGKFAGHYDILRRLTLSLWRGINDQKSFETWLDDWNEKSDWSDLSGGSMTSFAKSLLKSDAGGDVVKPWATAWAIATENGWKCPKWAMPPRELDSDKLTVDVQKKISELQKGIEKIDKMNTPTERALATQSMRDQLGIKEREFATILTMLQEELMENSDGGYWSDVVANAKKIEEAIERFLPFGAVTMLGADPGTGKSVFIYRVAEAAAYGNKFMGQLNCVKGNVLIVQKDESNANLAQKDEKIQLDDPDRNILVKFKFSGGHFPELVKWIKEHKARYVVMDSFASLFAGGADLTESDAGLYLYRLNAIAAEYNVAILLTHHLKKAPMSGERQTVSLSDFYGSTFIGAGTSDAWGLYKDPEVEGEDKPFILKNVKARSGIGEMGDKFQLMGNIEDLSLTMGAVNGMEDGMEKLKYRERVALKEIQKRTTVEERLSVAMLVDGSELTPKQARRAMDRISKLPGVGKLKMQASSNGGHQPIGYWWKGV